MLNYVQVTMDEYIERLEREGIQITIDEYMESINKIKNKKQRTKEAFVNTDKEIGTNDITIIWKETNHKGEVEFHAYTEKYILIWNPKHYNVPMRKLIKNKNVYKPNLWKKLGQKKNCKIVSDNMINTCKRLYPTYFTA